MAKFLSDTVLDKMIDHIADTMSQISVCNAEPTTFAEANATFMLALKTGIALGIGGGVYTKGNGAVDGRALTIAAITGITITNTGTATHLGLAQTAGSVFIGANTLTASTSLTATNTVDLATWKINVRDPT